MVAVVAATISASVALVVTVLTPALISLRARRQAVADLFDNAIAALLIAQSARHYPAGGPHFETVDWTADEKQRFLVQLQQTGIARWLQTQEEARVALARLEPFVPELRHEITQGWEIREDQEPRIRDMIERRKAEAVASERLFSPRRAPSPLRLPPSR